MESDEDNEFLNFLVQEFDNDDRANFDQPGHHFDESSNLVFSSTSASSLISSNPNSPRSNSVWSQNTVATAYEASLDQASLTEEAQEDLANNNDPNNNASNPEDFGQNFNFDPEAERIGDQFLASDVQKDTDPTTLDAPESASLTPKPSATPPRDHIDDAEIEDDVRVIQKLLPHKSSQEIRNHLEAYVFHPKRLKIVLNNLLEEQEEEDSSVKKNKVGNGLKCKNSAPRQTKPDGEPMNPIWNLPEPSTSRESAAPKRGHSQPTSTVTSEEQPSVSEPKKPRETRSGVSSPGDSNDSTRAKIEISEDHLYGPFNFLDHRPKSRKSKQKAFKSNLFRVREDVRLEENLVAGPSKTPPLIDLGNLSEGEEMPPPVVDITGVDQQEIRQLVNHLCGMFPETQPTFFQEHAEELVGKPAALDRFINEHLARGGQVPDDWLPKELLGDVEDQPLLSLDPGLSPPTFEDADMEPNDRVDTVEAQDNAQGPEHQPDDEDHVQRHLAHLVSVFPNTDPEFLHNKALEFADKEDEMARWIDETLENKATGLPTRKEYEERRRESELLEKYSAQVTVREILDMYDNDPESYFMDSSRKVSELYKRHALGQLKKEFRHTSVAVINKIFAENGGLYLPSLRSLKQYSGPKRKTKRQDHEAPMPTEIDLNFLKELQYSRIEEEVRKHLFNQEQERQQKIEFARQNNLLKLCDCCINDECLEEDLLPCPQGHLYCKECIQRASSVAIGEGKTELKCLMHCDEPFALSTLQKALSANTFSKWLEKIQLAEIEKANIDGLEQCPFCPFATIIDEPKEDFKVFTCQNPECGKESCRLCKEISHIPQRCEEVEKDAEVRKRTYIENKMAEALIRTCYKCKRPYVKQDGCNKITCSNCGALMCYICRKPVTGYDHFAGQGMEHLKDKCPLWSDNNSIHDRDVALGALEAKKEMDKEQPEVVLKHDPTKGLDFERAQAANRPRDFRRMREMEFPPGLEEFLPQDPIARQRMLAEQRMIERTIHRGGHDERLLHNPFFPRFNHRPFGDHVPDVVDPRYRIFQDMEEILRLREEQRQRQRDIRRREQQALEEVHELGRFRNLGHPRRPHYRFDPGLPNPANFPMPMNFGYQVPMPFIANPPPAHRHGPAGAVPHPPPAHPGMPRPAHLAPQPPALPLNIRPIAQNLNHVQHEPLHLQLPQLARLPGFGRQGPNQQ